MPDNNTKPHLFCFGLGYSAAVLAMHLNPKGWRISGTCRYADKQQELSRQGYHAYIMNEEECLIDEAIWPDVTHILHSIPASSENGMVTEYLLERREQLINLKWLGYLSTTGVYGNHDGNWVDESSPLKPNAKRSFKRVEAEQQWLASGFPVHIFRLSGIYGANRNYFHALREGRAKRIYREGQKFSRIHVEDIAQILEASIDHPHPDTIYNVADDEPAPQYEVMAYAAELLGIKPPPLIPFEQAVLTPMQQSFYYNNRLIDNSKIKKELGIKLRYPNYRQGLDAIYHGKSL